MMNAKAVGKRLQALRRSAGLTQENVAEALGISDNYVSITAYLLYGGSIGDGEFVSCQYGLYFGGEPCV